MQQFRNFQITYGFVCTLVLLSQPSLGNTQDSANTPAARAALVEWQSLVVGITKENWAQAQVKLDSLKSYFERHNLELPESYMTLQAGLYLAQNENQKAYQALLNERSIYRNRQEWHVYHFIALKRLKRENNEINQAFLAAIKSDRFSRVIFLAQAEDFLKSAFAERAASVTEFCREIHEQKLFSQLCKSSNKTSYINFFISPTWAQGVFNNIANWFGRNVIQAAPLQRLLNNVKESILQKRTRAQQIEFCTQPLTDVTHDGHTATGIEKSFLIAFAEHVYLRYPSPETGEYVIAEENSAPSQTGVFGSFEKRPNSSCEKAWIPKGYTENEYIKMIDAGVKFLNQQYHFEYDLLKNNCGSYAKLVLECLGSTIGYNPNLTVFSRWKNGTWSRKNSESSSTNQPTQSQQPIVTLTGEQVCKEMLQHVGFDSKQKSTSAVSSKARPESNSTNKSSQEPSKKPSKKIEH